MELATIGGFRLELDTSNPKSSASFVEFWPGGSLRNLNTQTAKANIPRGDLKADDRKMLGLFSEASEAELTTAAIGWQVCTIQIKWLDLRSLAA